MQIIIKCDCGNMVTISALNNKITQFRDCLEKNDFRYLDGKITGGKVKELRIFCNQCKSWIDLGVD